MILPLFKYRAWQREREAQYGLSFIRWQPWFAWYPVYSKKSDCWVWLETVDRRRNDDDYHARWEYGLIS